MRATKANKRFRVHIGYTRTGRDRWRYFPDVPSAYGFCDRVARKTGVILTIVEVK